MTFRHALERATNRMAMSDAAVSARQNRWLNGNGSSRNGKPFNRSCNRILIEQAGHHGRVEVGTNTYDQSILEIDNPAVAIVEAHAVLGRCERMKFNHR